MKYISYCSDLQKKKKSRSYIKKPGYGSASVTLYWQSRLVSIPPETSMLIRWKRWTSWSRAPRAWCAGSCAVLWTCWRWTPSAWSRCRLSTRRTSCPRWIKVLQIKLRTQVQESFGTLGSGSEIDLKSLNTSSCSICRNFFSSSNDRKKTIALSLILFCDSFNINPYQKLLLASLPLTLAVNPFLPVLTERSMVVE